MDLKLDNVVITDEINLALIDFAHGHELNTRTNKGCGTEGLWAPEQITAYESGVYDFLPQTVDIF